MRILWLVEVPVWVPWGLESLINFGLAAVGAVLTALYFHQDKLIYMSSLPPGSRETVSTPDQLQMHDYENVTISTPDNVKITGFAIKFRPQLERLVRVEEDPTTRCGCLHSLYLHANAGNMGHRLPIARAIRHHGRMNVFLLSYRGYGKSEGIASEKGMKIDAQAALDWISNNEELGKTKIVLYGQSIGGAVAIDLAARNPDRIAAVMIENTFLEFGEFISAIECLRTLTGPSAETDPICHACIEICNISMPPSLGLRKVQSRTYPSNVPMLFLSGGSDELIPQRHMIELVETVRKSRSGGEKIPLENSGAEKGKIALARNGNGVRWVEFASGGHNDTCMQPGYFQEIDTFLRELAANML
ncbi:Alpha/Beta hydrolase protein [Obelidium mucronatum]|nr:Alpha/Beta hydrolase protein [Obelidium mucronatum]